MAKMDNKIVAAGRVGQTRLIILIFAVVLALLSAGYYFFIRTDYSLLFSDLRSSDAAAIVTELDKQGIAYRLRDGGATILVPSDKAASVRLAIAGSDLPMKGMVGFELFNESDMGLTDFAQRVNYQRALQGELARTIMMMDGIENARVHLAMPERSLFRGNRAESKAAVTVTPRPGKGLNEERVTGIQRLVAAAVPDLALTDVVVLDDAGRVVSATAATGPFTSPQNEEQAAVQQYFRARARAAVETVLPGLEFDVRALILPRSGEPGSSPEEWEAGAGKRDFGLRILVVTNTSLSPDDEALTRNAVARAVELSEAAGDSLVFTVAPLYSAAAAPVAASSDSAVEPARRERTQEDISWSPDWWTMLAALVVLAAALLLYWSRGEALSLEERDVFVGRIRKQLELAEGRGDA